MLVQMKEDCMGARVLRGENTLAFMQSAFTCMSKHIRYAVVTQML